MSSTPREETTMYQSPTTGDLLADLRAQHERDEAEALARLLDDADREAS